MRDLCRVRGVVIVSDHFWILVVVVVEGCVLSHLAPVASYWQVRNPLRNMKSWHELVKTSRGDFNPVCRIFGLNQHKLPAMQFLGKRTIARDSQGNIRRTLYIS